MFLLLHDIRNSAIDIGILETKAVFYKPFVHYPLACQKGCSELSEDNPYQKGTGIPEPLNPESPTLLEVILKY
mgnify:FL=1